MSSTMETFNNICSYNFGQRLPKLLLLLGLSAIGVTLSLRYIKRRKIIYQKYGKVLKLIIYPIKSLPGIEIEEMEMTPSGSIAGLLRDRGWVLVDRYDRFITIRQEPSLVKLSVSFNSKSGCITVTSPSGDIIKVDAKEDDKFNKQDVIKTRIWGTPIQGIDCGPECARFFQKFLDREGIKLLRYHSNFEQRPALKFRDNEWTRDGGASIVYHDESPCLIINENSVKQLNDWLDEYKVTYKNFRPTILIEAPTFSEDLWEFMKIGDLEFHCLSKCRRCKVTTTDPSTGERHNEPLVTLRKYRSLQEHEKKMGQGPKMGIHVRSMKKWKIRVGQDVYGCNSSS